MAFADAGPLFNLGDVAILIGEGNGRFSAPMHYDAGESPQFLAIGDFDEDGHQDLAVADGRWGSVNVAILMGTGTGAFSNATFYGIGGTPRAIAVGDFDEDGHQDLAVANEGEDYVAIYRGTGTGGSCLLSNYIAGNNPYELVVGDFDEDKHQDIAVANPDDDEVSILFGTGTGSFSSPSSFRTGNGPGSLVAGDLNEDGYQDLAVRNGWSRDVTTLMGTGTGVFSASSHYGTNGNGIAIGDFDEDGHRDLATSFVTILLGNWRAIDVEIASPVTEIPRGEGLPFTVTITNRTDTTIALDVVLRAKLVGGPTAPLFGPQSLTLQGGQEISAAPSIDIPTNTPLGDYIVTCDNVIDKRTPRRGFVPRGSDRVDRPQGN